MPLTSFATGNCNKLKMLFIFIKADKRRSLTFSKSMEVSLNWKDSGEGNMAFSSSSLVSSA